MIAAGGVLGATVVGGDGAEVGVVVGVVVGVAAGGGSETGVGVADAGGAVAAVVAGSMPS